MKTVDVFAKDLHKALKTRNLTDIVDIVFVSDHGMADTSNPEWVFIDEYLDKEALDSIEHEDGWPSMGLRFSPGVDSTAYLNILLEAAKNNKEKFDVYTHDTMPERYHFSHNPRIAPIYIVPKYGYALTTRGRGESSINKGVSLPHPDKSRHVLTDVTSRATVTTIGTSVCTQCSLLMVRSRTS